MLSRHVDAIMHENILDRNILREQAKDTCTKQKSGNYSSRREFFLDDKRVMYRRQPYEHLVYHIKENHDQVFVAHPGVKRTRDFISLKYW